MSSLSIKLFDKGYVGFADRDTESGTPLGFLTPWGEDAAAVKRMATVDRWASKKLKAAVINNEPVSGFRISDYSRRGGWRRTGATMIRIEDPRGFELEISVDNLIQVMSENTVINGEIMVPCTWGRDGADNVLLPTTSEPYQAAVLNTERSKLTVTLREVKIGNKIELKDGRIGYYYGPAYRIERTSKSQFTPDDARYFSRHDKEQTTINIGHETKKNYAVMIVGDRDNEYEPYLELSRALKISRVIDDCTLTFAEAEVKMNEHRARYDNNVIAYLSSIDYEYKIELEDTTIRDVIATTEKTSYGHKQCRVLCHTVTGVDMIVESMNLHTLGDIRRYTTYGHLGNNVADSDVYGQLVNVAEFMTGKYTVKRNSRYALAKDDQIVHFPESDIQTVKCAYAMITNKKTGVTHKCKF